MCNCYKVTPPALRKSALGLRWLESRKGEDPAMDERQGLLVRPTVQAPVYTVQRGCSRMRWGFQRPWAKSINNARIEKRGTMWKKAWATGRCLIPMSGWYEFSGETGRMTCHFLEPVEGEPLLAAGLWEPHEELGDCFTMIMMESDPATLLGKIHNRMPVILTPEDGDRWLAAPLDDLQPSAKVELKQRIVPSPLKKAMPAAVPESLPPRPTQGELF